MTTQRPDNTFWQAGRYDPMLHDPPPLVDARTREVFLGWAEAFSRGLTYFDTDGTIIPPTTDDAPWLAFWRTDVAVLLAEISLQSPVADYLAAAEDSTARQCHAARLVDQIIDWQIRAADLAMLAPPTSVEARLLGVLNNAIRNELHKSLPASLAPRVFHRTQQFVQAAFSADADETDESLHSLLSRVVDQIVQRAKELMTAALTEKTDHGPQVGLFLAFLEMFSHVQNDLNGLAERHLDFYYRDVLRMAPHPATPDHVNVAFQTAPHAKSLILPKGSALTPAGAGGGNTVVFETDEAVSVDPVTIVAQQALRVRSLRSRGARAWVTGVAAFPVVPSPDGLGGGSDDPGTAWPLFGPEGASPQSEAEIGFAIAASTLAAPSGSRQITVTLDLAGPDGWTLREAIAALRGNLQAMTRHPVTDPFLANQLAQALRITLTSDADILYTVQYVKIAFDPEKSSLTLRLTVPATDPPIAANPKDPLSPDTPVLTVTCMPNATAYAVTFFAGVRITATRIAVDVTGCTEAAISTTTGVVPLQKPFPPFGAAPEAHAALYVRHPALQHPALRSVGVTLDWQGLPETPEAFAANYAGYPEGFAAANYRVALSLRSQSDWLPLAPVGETLPLFDGTGPRQTLRHRSRFAAPTPGDFIGGTGPNGTPNLRLSLLSPAKGFGQKVYPEVLAGFAIAQTAAASALRARVGFPADPGPPPKPPLDPQVTRLALDYSTVQSAQTAEPSDDICLFSLTPMGARVDNPDGRLIDDTYVFDGAYLIGMSGVQPPQPISLYLDLDTTPAQVWSMQDRNRQVTLRWRYFDGTNWCAFADADILEDDTMGLRRAGIIKLALPAAAAPGARYPGGLHWIAVTAEGDLTGFARLRGIYPNAVRATGRIAGGHRRLAANSLSRLQTPQASIKAVLQPQPSFGGRAAEDTIAFRQRVSERLSHKDRAVAPRDYAHLILQAFPQIAQVSVVAQDNQRLDIVVVPHRTPRGDWHPRVPRWLRMKINAYLAHHIGIEAKRIMVRNASFEAIRVTATVTAARTAPPGLLGQVSAAINRFIAPWHTKPDAPLPIGTARLDTASLAAMLEDLDGVAAVAGLTAVQMFQSGSGAYRVKDTAFRNSAPARCILMAGGPCSVFVPAPDHRLEFQTPGSTAAARPFRIGDMAIGQDLILSDPADTFIAPEDLLQAATHPDASYGQPQKDQPV